MKSLFRLFFLLIVAMPLIGEAQLTEIFDKVNKLVSEKNFPKAMSELTWANKEIEKLHLEHLKSFLPETIADFTGKEIEASSNIGIVQLQRDYQTDWAKVRVVVTGTGGDGAFGGLAALTRMGAMMGNQPGTETIRIGDFTASLSQEKGRKPELTVFLDGGYLVKLEVEKGDAGGKLKDLANGMKLAELNKYLKG